jgi:hypothetical protein
MMDDFTKLFKLCFLINQRLGGEFINAMTRRGCLVITVGDKRLVVNEKLDEVELPEVNDQYVGTTCGTNLGK